MPDESGNLLQMLRLTVPPIGARPLPTPVCRVACAVPQVIQGCPARRNDGRNPGCKRQNRP